MLCDRETQKLQILHYFHLKSSAVLDFITSFCLYLIMLRLVVKLSFNLGICSVLFLGITWHYEGYNLSHMEFFTAFCKERSLVTNETSLQYKSDKTFFKTYNHYNRKRENHSRLSQFK